MYKPKRIRPRHSPFATCKFAELFQRERAASCALFGRFGRPHADRDICTSEAGDLRILQSHPDYFYGMICSRCADSPRELVPKRDDVPRNQLADVRGASFA